MNWPFTDKFMIESLRWPRGEAPLASHIENAQHLRYGAEQAQIELAVYGQIHD